jgi:ribosomal protein S18 acetylase RimI-like enzyme
VDAAHALLRAAFAAVPGTGIPALDAFRARALAAPRGTRRVLLADGRVAAYLALSPPAPGDATGSIDVAARDPRWRGRGIGDRILGEAVRQLAAAGARQATLEVVAVNRAALRLYERYGFTVASRRRVLSRALQG